MDWRMFRCWISTTDDRQHHIEYTLLDLLETIITHQDIVDNLRHAMDIDTQCFCSETGRSTCKCEEDTEEMVEEFYPIGIIKEVKWILKRNASYGG